MLGDAERLESALPPADAPEQETQETTATPIEHMASRIPVDVLGYPANGQSDAIALQMLAQLVDAGAIRLDVTSARLLSSEVIDLVRTTGARFVCIADLPPSPPSKTRYLVRKLRATVPEVKILVGRWAPAELADEDRTSLIDAGAHHVATTLLETREQLLILAAHELHIPERETSPAAKIAG